MWVTEQELSHIGATSGCADRDHDLVHELSRCLDGLWRYDQYVANTECRDGLKQFWKEVKSQEEETVKKLKELIANEIRNGCF